MPAVKTGWLIYFRNFSKYIGRIIAFTVAIVIGAVLAPSIINVTIGKLFLMGVLLLPVSSTFISLTLRLLGIKCRQSYPFWQILGLGIIFSTILILLNLTLTFVISIFSGFTIIFVISTVVIEMLFKGVITLAVCHVIAEDITVKECLYRAWRTLVSAPMRFVGITLLASIVGVSGFVVLGFGMIITLPIIFSIWAAVYQQLHPSPNTPANIEKE